MWDRIYHLILPVIMLSVFGAAQYMRYMRSSMLEVIHQDYIRTARAKGLAERAVIYSHAFKNAAIPHRDHHGPGTAHPLWRRAVHRDDL